MQSADGRLKVQQETLTETIWYDCLSRTTLISTQGWSHILRVVRGIRKILWCTMMQHLRVSKLHQEGLHCPKSWQHYLQLPSHWFPHWCWLHFRAFASPRIWLTSNGRSWYALSYSCEYGERKGLWGDWTLLKCWMRQRVIALSSGSKHSTVYSMSHSQDYAVITIASFSVYFYDCSVIAFTLSVDLHLKLLSDSHLHHHHFLHNYLHLPHLPTTTIPISHSYTTNHYTYNLRRNWTSPHHGFQGSKRLVQIYRLH